VSAFSNGFEWDCWSAQWCERCARYDDCAILDEVFVDNVKPAAWTEVRPGGLADRYECREFEEVVE
jgi:hypothetical protein